MIPSVVARQARANLLDYLRTTYDLTDEELERELFGFLEGPGGLFRGPYLDVRLPFRRAPEDADLPLDVRPAFTPYEHQRKAFERLTTRAGARHRHTLVTTGTGSGKTECFLFPILDHCLREKQAGRKGVKAILLYPMNALATDQAGRLARQLWDDGRLKGTVTAGLYVGGDQEGGRIPVKKADRDHLVDDRRVIREDPPDILLTNYKMLDFLLLRPDDRALWRENGPDTLRYLVLDELHSYDGAQGSDVACLIRRLKGRLGTRPGGLTCVGTSATIGEGDAASQARLRAFAGEVFDEEFEPESVIVEERRTIEQTLGEPAEESPHPGRGDLNRMAPEGEEEPEPWLAEQVRLWLGEGVDPSDPVAIGEGLRAHRFLHLLLAALRGGPTDLGEVAEGIAKREEWFEELDREGRGRVLDSFVAVLSHARAREAERTLPFLTVQVQLWLREVRGLLRAVENGWRFAWENELGGTVGEDGAREHWLPMVRCRECGMAGWAATMKEGAKHLAGREEDSIGRAWLERSPTVRYLAFGHGPTKEGPLVKADEYLCPACLTVGTEPRCSCRGEETPEGVAVRMCHEVTTEGVARFKPVCPDCGSDDSLIFLASRAASLLSVAISQLYQTRFNADRKMLAFTDSVQDASHRAGFFGARTYRFNIRAILQSLVRREGRVGLHGIGERLLEHALEHLGGPGEAVPVLVPRDLREHPDYEEFLARGGKAVSPRLRTWLEGRLGVEALFEYGLRVRQGRSLDKIGCSTAEVDAERFGAALEELGLVAEEEGILVGRSGPAGPEGLRSFLLGLVHRLRLRGGVDHPWLHAYIRASGEKFVLGRGRRGNAERAHYLPPFAPDAVLPRFLREAKPGKKKSVFDTFGGPAESWTWYRDWVARCFGVDRRDAGIDVLMRAALASLVRKGVFVEHEAEQGRRPIWGVNPAALTIVDDVRLFTCPVCRESVRAAAGEVPGRSGSPCPRYRCPGRLEGPVEPEETFYTRLFDAGLVAPVFSEEHTGLLTRETREKLEEAFKGDAPASPNLLVCTPTLEMGIDIGDLSTVGLCTVPPTPSNYLQRIGRAGRSTGNALALTMAIRRPHDLYFHADPQKLLRGRIDPPGCFLDAPEMLKRQVVAHAMDAWAREDTEVRELPRTVTQVLGQTGSAVFPGRFFTFYEARQRELIQSFLQRFDGGQLSQGNREELVRFALSGQVQEAITGAIEDVRTERERLRKLRRTARARVKELELHPERAEDPEDVLEATRSFEMLVRLLKHLGKKYILNVLTDAGVLPNYAFPEPGVTLKSVVGYEKDGKRDYRTYTFPRPASIAIRELAPYNTFYAEGRHVRVDELELGSEANPLIEPWRLCARCAYMEPVAEEDTPPAACPSCGDHDWPDSGRVKNLVRFQRARSMEYSLEVASADDGEDRDQVFYETLDLIHVERDNCSGARWIPEVPFGFEFLSGLKLREVNFGLAGEDPFPVAGQPVPEEGFRVCTSCGRVAHREAPGVIDHAPTCRTKRNAEERVESVYLYREVTSEALRILCPFVRLDQETGMASFKAALALGLRLRYGGRADHLRIKSMREPVGESGYKHFLVLFDTVPGGTGQLHDLHEDDAILDLFEQARRALVACRCLTEGKDGCYECLFAFQGQRDLEKTSSRRAQEILNEILEQRAKLVGIDTLSDVEIDSRVESELEEYFLRALGRRARREGVWEEKLDRGKKYWLLEVGGEAWELRPQKNLGRDQGIDIASRPDFLLVPRSIESSALPVAVFCDGFTYHVMPRKEEGRLHDDVRKRRSILESGRYRVWSVTWDDVKRFDEESIHLEHFLPASGSMQAGMVLQRWGCPTRSELVEVGSMELLWGWLSAPDEERWAREVAIVGVHATVKDPVLDPERVGDFEACLQTSPDPCETPPERAPVRGQPLAGVLGRKHLTGLAWLPHESLSSGGPVQARWTVRLRDDQEARSSETYKEVWNDFLHAWNLLQFSGTSHFTTTEEIANYGGLDYGERVEDEVPPRQAAEDTPRPEDSPWDADELTTEELEVLESVLAHHGFRGEVGFELSSDGLRVNPEATIAWPEVRVAVLVNAEPEDVAAFERAGWSVVTSLEDREAILRAIKDRREQGERS